MLRVMPVTTKSCSARTACKQDVDAAHSRNGTAIAQGRDAERPVSRADRIRQLAKRGRSDAEILQEIIKEFGSCSPSYIRTCARQRLESGTSKHDRRYLSTPLGQAMRKRHLNNVREAFNERHRILRATGDSDAANAASRKAYAEARAEGKTVDEARNAGTSARTAVLRMTGDKELARRAYAQARARSAGEKTVF